MPQLPLDVFRHSGSDDTPLAVCSDGRYSRILFCNALAQQQGICPGLSVAAARALSQSLRVLPRNSVAEQAALDSLAAWACQFTSLICPSPPSALLLEVQGSLRLFGGLQALLMLLYDGLQALGYVTRVASAPTPLAALSLARCSSEQHIDTIQQLPVALAALPLSVLDWEQELVDRLHGMGVRRLGELLHLPRDGLTCRLGPACVDNLDQLLGYQADLRLPWQPPERFKRRLPLPAEVGSGEALLFALQRLILELCGWLRGRDAGIQQMDVLFHHRIPPVTRMRVSLYRKSRDAGMMTGLVRERLDRLMLEQPVIEIELSADHPRPLEVCPDDLFSRPGKSAQTDLLDRLRARLGDDAVRGLSSVREHRPEYAWSYTDPGCSEQHDVLPHRPLWLLPVPRQLKMQDGWPCLQGKLELVPGRERIESGWWDDDDVRRDYFVARSPSGARYWIYHELGGERQWYLQGMFE